MKQSNTRKNTVSLQLIEWLLDQLQSEEELETIARQIEALVLPLQGKARADLYAHISRCIIERYSTNPGESSARLYAQLCLSLFLASIHDPEGPNHMMALHDHLFPLCVNSWPLGYNLTMTTAGQLGTERTGLYSGSDSIQNTGASLLGDTNIESLTLLVSSLFGFGLISVAQVYQFMFQLTRPSSTSSTRPGLPDVCAILEAHGRDLNATPWEGEMARLLEWAKTTMLEHSVDGHTQRRMRAVTLSLSGSGEQESLAEADCENSFRSPKLPSDEEGLDENNYGSHTSAHEIGVNSFTQSAETTELKLVAMLNQLEAGDFDHISDQIIEWVNKTSGCEGDGQALMRIIKLIYERARENQAFGEMYARLCRKMMEHVSPTVQDEAMKNWEGQPITGGMLFRKYLLNRCQDGFECRWSAKGARSVANDKVKRQGLGLVQFIGELFKLRMLTERIMHDCIQKLLSNVVNPEEEEIESLCKLLTTVGQSLDNHKARNHMDIYFERMQDMARNRNISPQMQFMLLEVIELRARHWQKCPEDPAPFGMTEDEAWDKAEKGVEEYLDDQNIDKALIALEALPSEQRHLFVDRLANAAMYGGNNVVVLAKNLLSTARTRSVISPEPFEHGIIPSIAFGSAKSQSLRPLAMPTTRPDPPKSAKLPKPDLPITNTITAKTLKSYLATALQILVLDVRPRDQVDSRRIPVDNVVCIEPIVLGRKGMSAKELQEALIISSKTERTLFEQRSTFDLVVLTDAASTEFKDPTTPLNLLFRIIYETEFLKPLRRSPVFLYGGIKAWADEVGEFKGEGAVVTPSVDVGKVWTRKPAVSGHPTAGRMSQDAGPPGSSFGAVRKPFTYPERSVSPPTSSGTPTYSRRSLEHMMSPPSPVSAAGYFEHPRHAYSGSVTLSTTRPASLDYHNLIRPPRTAASPAIGRVDSRPRIPQVPHFKPDYSVVYWRDEQLGMSGLRNMGNTGYMNSVLQCLSGTVPLTRFFTDRRWHHEVNMMNPLGTRGELANAFYALLRDIWQGDLPYLTPMPFRKSICAHARQFVGSEQHDAQEFLLFLLDGLHEDLNRIIVKPQFEELAPEREAELERMPKQLAGAHEWARYKRRNDSIVVDYFQGQFCNQMQCLTCGQTSTTYNAFLNLSVPIPAAKGVTRLPLDECIKALVGREVMDNKDAWHCPRCKTARRAAKQLTFSRMPPVLIIHLKRFSPKGPFTDKLETLVEFPLKDLDLTSYMPPHLTANMDKDGLERFSLQDPRAQIPPYKYELYGVTNHSGSLSNGHYTAFVKSRGKWMYCDDNRITPSEPKEVIGELAYILFYKRVPPENK